MIRGSFSHISLSDVILRTSCYVTIICTLMGSLGEGWPVREDTCGERFAPLGRIVGGDVTIPGEYPWMVSLQQDSGNNSFGHICGASIIDRRYVLTAAHCIDKPVDPSDYEIVVGLYKLSNKDKKPAKTYKIDQVIVHSGYNDETYENDIALLHLKEFMEFEGTFGLVNAICLPKTRKDPTGWATVTGWGDTTEGGNISDVLQAVTVPLVPRYLCRKNYLLDDPPFNIPETQICAGFQGKDSCQSDSGGPLIQKDKEGTYTLIGIVSYGTGCAQRKFPGVYTKVSSYLEWIHDRMMGKPQPEVTTVLPTTVEHSTVSPQKNGTFSHILLYSLSYQSKLIFMSQK